MTIVFEPKYNIGDVVCLKIEPEIKYVVEGYFISQINDSGEVISFKYSLYDRTGATFYYKDIDLDLIESIRIG